MDNVSKNINNTINFTINQRRGLYCVWVPLHDDGKAPLISIWIDPTMTAIEKYDRDESGEFTAINEGAVSEEIEDQLERIAA